MPSVSGMGKAVASAILLVAYPDKYGVWNNISEAALRELGIFPDATRGESTGQRYEQVNNVLLRLASDLGIDLWTLDALLWYVVSVPQERPGEDQDEAEPEDALGFSLERHLHEFLRDDWDRTELAKEWAIFEEDGDLERGYEYPTDVGRIDILARHRTGKGWLVVEHKRNQTADATVGQLLRYMGWVRRHLADPGEPVRGLIIAREADKGLRYALSSVSDVDMLQYGVTFSLQPVSPPGDEPESGGSGE